VLLPDPELLVPAHGIGGAEDLPVPLSFAVVAGVAALLVSLGVPALAWRTPRHQQLTAGRVAPDWLNRLVADPRWTWALRVLGLVFFGYLTWALVAGPDLVDNPVLGTFYVLVWVGIVPFSLLLGPVVRAFSPVRTLNALLARATGGDPRTGLLEYPRRLGCWPAAVGLFAFVWQELVDPESSYVSTVRLWLATYVALMLVGSAVFGETWFERADPFEVYSGLVARLSFWGREELGPDGEPAGRLVVRNPLVNLATVAPLPGLVAVVAVLLGSTAFDACKDQRAWIDLVDRLGIDSTLVDTIGLLVFCLVVAGTFVAASMLTGVGPGRRLPDLFAPSLVPIVAGYVIALYLSYFVEQGQSTLTQLSDPMVRGDDYLLTGNWSVEYWLSFHSTVLAALKVLAILAGHVVGVVAAHDRAVARLPARRRVSGQMAMLLLMALYTVAGLYLLRGGP
jgi:hypothetical protein